MQRSEPVAQRLYRKQANFENEPSDRSDRLNSLGAWASIGGFVLSVAALTIAVAAFFGYIKESIVHWYLIIANFSLLILIGFVWYRYACLNKELDEKRGALSTAIKEKEYLTEKYLLAVRGIENISRERTGVTDHFVAIYRGNGIDHRELGHRVCDFLNKLLTHTKEIFDVHTGYVCSVCIKIFLRHDAYSQKRPATGTPPHEVVRTLIRDGASSIERKSAADQDNIEYPYYKNTAFSDIMHHPDADNFWFSNDLDELGERYQNGHFGWRKYYNATAVIGIRAPTDGRSDYIIGFLCVDNLNGGFDSKHTKYILGYMANTLYYVLSSLFFVAKDGKVSGEKDA